MRLGSQLRSFTGNIRIARTSLFWKSWAGHALKTSPVSCGPGFTCMLRNTVWRTSRQNPGSYRMLFATGKTTRRLFREGDEAHPQRKKGKIVPDAQNLPPRYRYLLDWYHKEYVPVKEGAWLSSLKQMVGAGREIFKGVDPDEYVRQLREGWE